MRATILLVSSLIWISVLFFLLFLSRFCIFRVVVVVSLSYVHYCLYSICNSCVCAFVFFLLLLQNYFLNTINHECVRNKILYFIALFICFYYYVISVIYFKFLRQHTRECAQCMCWFVYDDVNIYAFFFLSFLRSIFLNFYNISKVFIYMYVCL